MTAHLYEPHVDIVLAEASRAAGSSADGGRSESQIGVVFGLAQRHAIETAKSGEDDEQSRRTLVAGLLAAHALPELLRNSDEDGDWIGRAVADALPTVRSAILSEKFSEDRFSVARELNKIASMVAGSLSMPLDLIDSVRDIVGLLHREGDEQVATAGRLAGRVADDPNRWRPYLATAWFGVCGPYMLLPREFTRAITVAMVRTGREKSAVARQGGISRSTLDSWLNQQTGSPDKSS